MLTDFYVAFGTVCFTLLGLWIIVVQTRHEDWRRQAIHRRRAYGVALHFSLPGTMAILSLIDTESSTWRVSFAVVAAGGAIVLLLVRGPAPTLVGTVSYAASVAVYVIIAIIAIHPKIVHDIGINAAPVRVEAVLLTLLAFIGVNVAWLLLFDDSSRLDRPREPSAANSPTHRRSSALSCSSSSSTTSASHTRTTDLLKLIYTLEDLLTRLRNLAGSCHKRPACPVLAHDRRTDRDRRLRKGVMRMKITVLGGTGLIGSQVVKILQDGGHEVVASSPATGLDIVTGAGLDEALTGADVVVNLTNSPTFDDASPTFFQMSMDNLLEAAERANVRHAIVLSIVGAELVPDLVYYRAKVLQENILKAGPVPYSVVRVTQFFEFIDSAMAWTSDENTVRLPATRIQPMASRDVAQAVADVCVGAPLQGTRNVAGPEVFTLDELGRLTLAARGDHRTVVIDDTAGLFAAAHGDVSSPRRAA